MSAPSFLHSASTLERFRQLEAEMSGLITETSVDGVLRHVVQVAARVIGARYAAVGVVAPDGKTLESLTTHGDERGAPPALEVTIPAANGGMFGTLSLADTTSGDTFSDEDAELATLLASRIFAAVENARHHEHSARLLEEVQQLQRTRERFFAMVNHELRNALAAVYGWSEMLVRKRDPATVPRAAFEVLDSAQHAITLINDLLDLSRLDEDRLQPVIRAVDPRSVASRAINRVTPAAELKRISVELTTNGSLPNCATDAGRVEQILVNLLGNAIRYAPLQSTVRVTLASRGRRVVFQVDDAGPGIQPADAERIFDVYVSRMGEDERGLGLGLPLSRRLARLLGGELRAVAGAATGGCFILEVPASGIKRSSRHFRG